MSKLNSSNSSVEYRQVPGYSAYRVGNDGTVWSRWKRGRIPSDTVRPFTDKWRKLKPSKIGECDHLTVHLCRDGQGKSFLVHRLVLIAFVGPCPEGMECRHFPDRDPSNNRLENLSWGTPVQNADDKRIHGTRNQGDSHANTKVSDDNVALIRKLHAENNKWGYQKYLAERFGISQSTLNQIVKGVRRKSRE